MSPLILPKRITECGRKSLICWVNKQLSLTLSDLTCLADGSIYCLLINEIGMHIIPRKKIRDCPSTLGYLHNYKLLQDAFFNLGVNKVIPVEQLMANDSRALQMFTSWFKCFFELNYSPDDRTFAPFDPDKPKCQSDACDEHKLVNSTKTVDKFRHKESVVKRRGKNTSTLSAEKNRLRGSGDVAYKDQPRKTTTYKRSEALQKEIEDQRSAATYTVKSQDDLNRLSDLSLTPIEKDTQTGTCLHSPNNNGVQRDQMREESNVHKKITKEKLRPENVSNILENATKLSCEAEITSKCEDYCNFETGTSTELLGFTKPEQGVMTLSKYAAGALNGGQLGKELLTEKPIDENKECISECITELESKTLECSLKKHTGNDHSIQQSLAELVSRSKSASEPLNECLLHKKQLVEQPIDENQEFICEFHTEIVCKTSNSSLEEYTEGEDAITQLFCESVSLAKSTPELVNEDKVSKEILEKQQIEENPINIFECFTGLGCKLTECPLREQHDDDDDDDDHPTTNSLSSLISPQKSISGPLDKSQLEEQPIDENKKTIFECYTQPMSKILESLVEKEPDDDNQIKQPFHGCVSPSKSASRPLNEGQLVKDPLTEQPIDEHQKCISEGFTEIERKISEHTENDEQITKSFSESVSPTKSISKLLNEDQLLKEILSDQPIDENQEGISECFTELMSKISECPCEEHTDGNDLITRSLCGPVSVLKSTPKPLNEGHCLKELLAESPIDENKEGVSEGFTNLGSQVAECLLKEHTENDYPITRPDSLSKFTAEPLSEDQLLKEISAEQPIDENQEIISECFTELMSKTAECSWEKHTDDDHPITQSLCESTSLSKCTSVSLNGCEFAKQQLPEEPVDENQEYISQHFTEPMSKISESSFEEHTEDDQAITQSFSGSIPLSKCKSEPINERQFCEEKPINENQEYVSECFTEILEWSFEEHTLEEHTVTKSSSGFISIKKPTTDSLNEKHCRELSSEKQIDENQECISECLTEVMPKIPECPFEEHTLEDHSIAQPSSGSISLTQPTADPMNEIQFCEELSSEMSIGGNEECISESYAEPSLKISECSLETNTLDDNDAKQITQSFPGSFEIETS